jgi:hypothetical protein
MKLKKSICFLLGHKVSATQCPYTGNTYSICSRCFPKDHTVSSYT